MSSPPTASDVTSPAVRSSDATALRQDASSAAPTAEPEAIRPTLSYPLNSTQSLHRSAVDPQGQQPTNGCGNGDRDDRSESNATTPRLPPVRQVSDDLDTPEEEDTTDLEKSLSSSRHTPERVSLTSKAIYSTSATTIGVSLSENQSKPDVKPKTGNEGIENSSQRVPSDLMRPSSSSSDDSAAIAHAVSAGGGKQTLSQKPVPVTTPQPLPSSAPALSLQHTVDPKSEDISFARNARQEAFGEQRARSSSRSSQKKVEKSIEATLADEAPIQNARSRKSSHMLGLFRENTNPDDRKISQTKSPPAVPEDSRQLQTRQTSEQILKQQQMADDNTQGNRSRSYSALSSASHPSTVEHDLRVIRVAQGNNEKAGSARTVFPARPRGNSLQNVLDRASKREEGSSRKRLPPRLLEEIRQHHNLHTPVHDKFRQSQAKTADQRPELRKALSAGNEVPSGRYEAAEVGSSDGIDEHEGDEDDSDKEHISSALYYPHQAPSPDALLDVDIGEARKRKDESEDEGSKLPEPAMSPTEEADTAQNVDIHLQSRNQSRYLHGDLQPTSVQHDFTKYVDTASSASESESESVASSNATDETEMTPRASPKSRASFLHFKAIKPTPSPLGAVELKPYNHQVGGHTTVFRFSKRAVCKQLTSRENRFYETVEKYHPELLKFLPK